MATAKTLELSITPRRTIHAKIIRIKIEQLRLDPTNVRFRHLGRILTDKEMEDEIWNESDTRKLYREIKYSEGLQNKPIIDNNFVVKEGCRRIVCCRKILDDPDVDSDIKKTKFGVIQCIQLPKNIDPKDIAIYLTRVHVTGNKTWGAFNKAAHVYDLHTKYNMTLEEIRKAVSMGKITVMNMIKAYQTLEKYAEKYSDIDKKWIQKYSYFLEYFKRNKIKEWIAVEENKEKFMSWVANGKFKKGSDVRDLANIVLNPEALRILDSPKGNHEKALEHLAKVNPPIGSKLYKIVDKITISFLTNKAKEIAAASKNPAKLKLLKDMRLVVDEIISKATKK